MPRQSAFVQKLANLKNILSFDKVHGMIEGLIDKEYQYGVFDSPPDLFIDLASIDDPNMQQMCVSIWDKLNNKVVNVPFTEMRQYLMRLHDMGLCKVALLLPNISIYGTLSITRLISVHKDHSDIQDSDLPAVFAKNLNVDLENSNSDLGYVICETSDKKTRFMASAIPEDGKTQLEDSTFFKGLLGTEFTAVRVVDRVIPLSNYLINRLDDNNIKMYLCIEQRGNNLYIWNLFKLDNGTYVPVGADSQRVPKVETHDALVNLISLMENELIRIKNYTSPERVLIISDNTPMLDGMFTIDELVSVCQEVLDIPSPDTGDIRIFKEENAAITGSLDTETKIEANLNIIKQKAGY